MNQKHILQAMVVFVAGLMTLPAWADPPGREGTSSANPPVMQELDRMTESPPAGSAQQDSGRHFAAKKRERLIQMLQLDEATRGKLLQRMEQLDQKAEDLRRQRREAFSALREQRRPQGSRRGQAYRWCGPRRVKNRSRSDLYGRRGDGGASPRPMAGGP